MLLNKNLSCLFISYLLLSSLTYGQGWAEPDIPLEISPGETFSIRLTETDSISGILSTFDPQWLIQEEDRVVISGELQEAERIHRWRFRSMKPGNTVVMVIRSMGSDEYSADTLRYPIRIGTWKPPLKQIEELAISAPKIKPDAPHQIRAGGSIVVTQTENKNTSFFWVMSLKDPQLLSLDRQQYFPNQENTAAAGTHGWRIRALRPGKTEITLKFVGPGKRGARPALETVTYQIEVLP